MSLSFMTGVAYGPMLAGAVLGVVIDAFGSRRQAVVWSGLGLAVTAGLFAYLSATYRADAVWGVLRQGGAFSAVGASVAGLAAVAVLGGVGELSRREWGGSLAALMAFAAAASVVIAQSKDITLLLVALETAAVCAYAIVASGGRAGSREAALKYFVQGAIATAFFLLGTAITLGALLPTGDLDALGTLAIHLPVPQAVVSAALVLLVGALAFKSGAAPFHAWVPDAYENAPAVGSAFLAAAAKVGAVVALTALVALSATAALELPLTAVMVVLAVLSILVGSVAALRQRSYTRMLGYAGVAQVGYALIAAAMGHGMALATFFIVSYAIASAGTFLAASAFREVDPTWDGSIDGMSGLGRKAPATAVATGLLVISLAGIPPLLGFWAKFGAFLAAFVNAGNAYTQGQTAIAWLSALAGVAGIVGSVVSLGYYGAVLRVLFSRDGDATPSIAENPEAARRSRSSSIAVIALAVVVVALGLVPLFGGVTALLRVFA